MAKSAKPDHALRHAPKLQPSQAKANGKGRKRVALVSEKENMTDLRWQTVIEATAHGKTRKQAAKQAGISKRTIDAYLISNISAYSQLRDAQLLYLRRAWPSERIEEFLLHIARGRTMQRAADKMKLKKKELDQLYHICLKDKAVRKMYDEAREMQAEAMLDEVRDIADDGEDDRLSNGKINHEVVNRSKLRVETRWRIMSAMHHKRFGEKRQLEHSGEINMNHAAILSGGRRRLEKLNAERAAKAGHKPATIDNETGREVQPQ